MEAKVALQAHLNECELAMESHKRLDTPFVALADCGAVHETRARIAWLEEITREILSLAPPSQ